jgi:hypothetical protein
MQEQLCGFLANVDRIESSLQLSHDKLTRQMRDVKIQSKRMERDVTVDGIIKKHGVTRAKLKKTASWKKPEDQSERSCSPKDAHKKPLNRSSLSNESLQRHKLMNQHQIKQVKTQKKSLQKAKAQVTIEASGMFEQYVKQIE